MSEPSAQPLDDWQLAHVEVRFDGKHSMAEDSFHFITHGSAEELDALVVAIKEAGRWARWTPEELLTPVRARETFDWVFEAQAAEDESDSIPEPAPEDPKVEMERRRWGIEQLLKSNADHAARTQRRHEAGHLSQEQADGLLLHWRNEREQLERELEELSE